MSRRPLLIMATLLTACTTGADYRPPDTRTAANWHTNTAHMSSQAVYPEWWQQFKDPLLTQLIQEAVAQNFSLKQAQAKLREARAYRESVSAERFPTLNAGAGVTRTHPSQATSIVPTRTRDIWSAQLDAKWELDIFGGKQRALEAAQASLEASGESWRDTLVSLIAELALNYLDIRNQQQRLVLAQETLTRQHEAWQLVHSQRLAGLLTQQDEDQAQSALEQARIQLSTRKTALQQAKNGLAILLGRQPGNLPELEAPGAIPVPPADIAVGIPADILRQRPDIRRSERQLAAATAQVAVAQVARYPVFNLVGTLGLQALDPGHVVSTNARLFSVGTNAGWVLFDAGKLQQNVRIRSAQQEQALYGYRQTVLTALRDVENALVAYAEQHNQQVALRAAVLAAQSHAALAQTRYHAGLADFSQLLGSQLTLISLQDQLVQSESTLGADLIRLYKELGGGWQNIPVQESSS